MFLKDKTASAYEAFSNFEKFSRMKGMSICEYINKFERLKYKIQQFGTLLFTDILANRLLKSANLKDDQEPLIRATIVNFSYEDMKTQLKKVFDSSELDDPSVRSSAKLLSAKDEVAPQVVHNPLYTERSFTPDVNYKTMYDITQSYIPTYQIELSHANSPGDVHIEAFVHESLGRAIVDSEVTATVSGRQWMECYIDALSEKVG